MLVIYHANCADGFCAAWLLQDATEFHSAKYGDAPPDVKDKDVYIVDFSYPREILLRMKEEAHSLVVLDHHKTAQKALEGLDFCTFDLNKSGAHLVCDHYEFESNWIVDYTEDRDLWRWNLSDSREVNAALSSYPKDFKIWNKLILRSPIALASEGAAILRYQNQFVSSAIEHATTAKIGGFEVPCVNTTVLMSEIGNALSEGKDFAASYFIRQDGKFAYSLRSSESGLDVSTIAKLYGGGGHRNAAGFLSDVKL